MTSRAVALYLLTLLFAVSALGQVVGRGGVVTPAATQPAPQTYGTASLTYVSVNANAFEPVDSNTTYGATCCSVTGIYRTAGDVFWEAPIYLPAGASIQELQLIACDTSATNQVGAWITVTSNGGSFSQLVGIGTGGASTPGCSVFAAPVTPPLVVDNAANMYGLEARLEGTDSTALLIGMRVGYKLQVSPAPQTATFTDVPTTHPFFQYIEALASAGITSGCAPGQFCPDAPVTRGQMAVFLSRALGLHWPN